MPALMEWWPGLVYVLWAEGTVRFKIGYTHGLTVHQRASHIETSSPFPLRILAAKPGTMKREHELHLALRDYRVHREWFELPEPAVWWLMKQFDIEPVEGAITE